MEINIDSKNNGCSGYKFNGKVDTLIVITMRMSCRSDRVEHDGIRNAELLHNHGQWI